MGCPPRDIRINAQKAGKKPFLADHSYHFNCSSSQDVALIALSKDHAVGVDIQAVLPELDFNSILAHQFSDNEIEQVQQATHPVNVFYTGWARKEAIAKAFGWGLAAPWKTIEVLPQVLTGKDLYKGRELIVHDIEVGSNTFAALATLA
jgi:4'-phosphopantetheinyl transferase